MSNVSIVDVVYGARDDFMSVQSDPTLNFEREAGFALQQLQENEYSMKIARSCNASVINAVVNIAAIGISLNPANKQAYLVPRNGKICLDISYRGLMDLAIQYGSIKWGQAKLVYEQDLYESTGIDTAPVHRYSPYVKDRGALIGVYVTVKTDDGDYLTEEMSIDEVYAIRDRSSAWKAWVSKKKSCPWVTDEGEMIKKTVVKRASKYWPKNDRLNKAIEYLNTDGDEGLQIDGKPDYSDVLDTLIKNAQGCQTAESLAKTWSEGLAAIQETGDMSIYEKFKAFVSARGKELKDLESKTVEEPA